MQNIISKATNTQSHTASHTHTHTHIMVVLAEAYDGRLLTCQILIRMWRLSLATCLRVKRRRDSKIKWLITVSHLNTTDIRESLISVNFHSASILECKSNYHSHEQCQYRWECPTERIGWLWLSGRWTRVIILSLGGYMLSLIWPNPPSPFPPVFPSFLCFPSPHQALHQPAAAASCSLLPHLPLSSALLSRLMNTSHYCFASYWFHSPSPVIQTPDTAWQRQAMSTRVTSMYISS